jgi:hypothetical protein
VIRQRLTDRLRDSAMRRPVGLGRAAQPLVDAIAALYDKALDRVLTSPLRVTSAMEARALLAGERGAEELADDVQRIAVLAVPVARTLIRGARFTKVPWALVASTSISIATAVRTGVREVQVLGSLLAYRLERETGRPADPALVKKLAVELYLQPKRVPDLSDRRLRVNRLARRWIFRGAVGRSTAKSALRALAAAEKLDVTPLVDRWSDVGERRPPGELAA